MDDDIESQKEVKKVTTAYTRTADLKFSTFTTDFEGNPLFIKKPTACLSRPLTGHSRGPNYSITSPHS